MFGKSIGSIGGSLLGNTLLPGIGGTVGGYLGGLIGGGIDGDAEERRMKELKSKYLDPSSEYNVNMYNQIYNSLLGKAMNMNQQQADKMTSQGFNNNFSNIGYRRNMEMAREGSSQEALNTVMNNIQRNTSSMLPYMYEEASKPSSFNKGMSGMLGLLTPEINKLGEQLFGESSFGGIRKEIPQISKDVLSPTKRYTPWDSSKFNSINLLS